MMMCCCLLQVASSPTAATPHPADTHVATCLDSELLSLVHINNININNYCRLIKINI